MGGASGHVHTVCIYDSYKRKTILPWTIYQEDDERTTVKELYNYLANRPNSEDLAGHSVDEIRVGSSKDSLDIVGDSSKYYNYSSYIFVAVAIAIAEPFQITGLKTRLLNSLAS